MTTLPDQRPESLGGYIVHNIPFPKVLNEETLALLKQMTPIQIEQVYSITYLHSYGQDSPFFAGLANGVLLGSHDPQTGYTYANPRGHDMTRGNETQWVVLPNEGTVHAFTFVTLVQRSFCRSVLRPRADRIRGANTLFLTRLLGVDPDRASLDWIGMKVKAKYLRNSKLKPTDVYFVLIE
jgi:uncharacterized OB-fold protein